MKRALVLPLIAALAFASPSRADIPTPPLAQYDPCIVSCPAGDSIFTFSAHFMNGNPVVGGDVVLDFSYCPNVHPAESNPPGQYQVGSNYVIKRTDASGRADIPLAAAGTCGGVQVRVYCSGILYGQRPIASFDQDGDLGVTHADLALVSGKIGTLDRTADFDCDGSVTQADYDIAAAHLYHAHPNSALVGVGDGPAIEFGVRPMSNPSPGAVEFELRAPEGGWARHAIYDISGRLLATVLDREVEAGIRRVSWSGRDDAGRAVASGVYRYRLTVGARQAQGSLIVAR